jgi:hypothetical protein
MEIKDKLMLGNYEVVYSKDGRMGFIPRENTEEVKVRKMYSTELLEEYYRLEDGLKTIKQHIKDKVRKSFEVDWGISDKLSDKLFTETVVELQIIEQMIDQCLEGKDETN